VPGPADGPAAGPVKDLPKATPPPASAGGLFQDSRTGKNGWHGWTGRFRQSVFGRLGGYEDVNAADRLGRDPATRWIVGGKAGEIQAASTSRTGRFETELLATEENLSTLAMIRGQDHPHDAERKLGCVSVDGRGASG